MQGVDIIGFCGNLGNRQIGIAKEPCRTLHLGLAQQVLEGYAAGRGNQLAHIGVAVFEMLCHGMERGILVVLVDIVHHRGNCRVLLRTGLRNLRREAPQKNAEEYIHEPTQNQLAMGHIGQGFRVHRHKIVQNRTVISRRKDNGRIIAGSVQRVFEKVRKGALFLQQRRAHFIEHLPLDDKFDQNALVGVVDNLVGNAILQQAEVALVQLVFPSVADMDAVARKYIQHGFFEIFLDLLVVSAGIRDVEANLGLQ